MYTPAACSRVHSTAPSTHTRHHHTHRLPLPQQAQALARTHYDTALNHQYSKDAQSLASEMRQLQSSVESGLTGTVDALGTLRVLEARLAQLEGNVLSASMWGEGGMCMGGEGGGGVCGGSVLGVTGRDSSSHGYLQRNT